MSMDVIDRICSRWIWRRQPGRIYHSYRTREFWAFLWGNWAAVLPWRVQVWIYNWMFRRDCDWRTVRNAARR